MSKNNIENKYLSLETKNKDFKKLFNLSHKNMVHYFSMYLNTKDKVDKYLEKNNDKWSNVQTCRVPDNDNCEEYSDVKNQNSKVYNNFIENLIKKAHSRVSLTFVDYIQENYKKADITFSDFFDNKEIGVTYCTNPIMLCMEFKKDFLNIVYMINHYNKKKSMLEIKIDHNKKIVSTEIYFNDESQKETETIVLNNTQLDYLIVLVHYSDGEDINFDAEKYVDDILEENYQELIDYIKVKEMIHI